MDDYGKVVSVFLKPAICDRCGEKCLPDMRFATRRLCKFCGDAILSSAQPMPDDKIKYKE